MANEALETKHPLLKAGYRMTDEELETIRKRFGFGILDLIIDESIAGGFLIEDGDNVYDYSLGGIISGRAGKMNTGRVMRVADGVASLSGLSEARSQELLKFESGAMGLAMNLNEENVGSVLLTRGETVKPGDKVYGSGRLVSIPVGGDLLGRVIDPLGLPIDRKGPYTQEKFMEVERIAPGVMMREPVNRPLHTGIKVIDGLIPIGRGQRELIVGDRQIGKSMIAVSTIINQKDEDVVCVYVSIGQKLAVVARTAAIFEQFGVMKQTVIVAAAAADGAALQYLAPYSGCAIAEYFMEKGKDVLVVYDDLTKHAWAYREISLLLGRPSGREAYPGDIFYSHSRLLERACQLSKEQGGGSITALPIVETQSADVSAYIPTNVISITDGQIYLTADLFNSGQKPAVDIGNSVSRVGSSAQTRAVKQVAGKLRLELAQFRELEAFAQFATNLDQKTQAQLERGRRLTELLKQSWDKVLRFEEEAAIFWAAANGYLDKIKAEQVEEFEEKFLEELRDKKQAVLPVIRKEKVISDKSAAGLKTAAEKTWAQMSN